MMMMIEISPISPIGKTIHWDEPVLVFSRSVTINFTMINTPLLACPRQGVTIYLFSVLRSPCEMINNRLTVSSSEERKKAASTCLSRQHSPLSWNYEWCMHIQANMERDDDIYSLISRKESSRKKPSPSMHKIDEMKTLLSNVGSLSNWGIQRRSFRCFRFLTLLTFLNLSSVTLCSTCQSSDNVNAHG